MRLRLKNKMEEFFETISDREKSQNKKLNMQILFLKKYLGTFGESDDGHDQNELIQKYFHFQLRNEIDPVR